MPTSRGAMIFDLDGTLTVPVLEFDAIRDEIGLPPGPILEAVAKLPPQQRLRAKRILDAHEEQAATQSQLQPGADECIKQLRERAWPIAILTRNARRWAEFVLNQHNLRIDTLFSRDDGVIKPSPEPIHTICHKLDCNPKASWMIGDHAFDIESGQAAGCITVYLENPGAATANPPAATHCIRHLSELLPLTDDR